MIYQKKLKGVIERPRSLNPGKAIAMAICPIIVHFITYHALDAWLCVHIEDVEKKLARRS